MKHLCALFGFQALSPSLHDFLAGADGSTECMVLVHSNSLYYLADLLVSCHTNTSFIISSILLTGEPISLEEGLNKKKRKKKIAQIKLVNSACFSLKIDQGIPLMDWVRKGNWVQNGCSKSTRR